MALIQRQDTPPPVVVPRETNSIDVLNQTPCLTCLSEKELQAVLVYLLSTQTDYSLPDDLRQLMQDSVCINCFSNKEKLQAVVAALADELVTDETIPEIRDAMKCLLCATPGQIQSAIIYLLIQIITMSPRILDSGIATLSASAALVVTNNAKAANPIVLGYYSQNGSVGSLRYENIVEGVSFQISSTAISDTNLVAWAIVRPS